MNVSHESNAEVELLKAFHTAHRRGELKEAPLTNATIPLEDVEGSLFPTHRLLVHVERSGLLP